MESLLSLFGPLQIVAAFAVALVAGIVKGAVGFAMPMILVSGLGLFLPGELALAGLILPTLATNGVQALRQGPRAAWESVRRFRVFLGVGLIFLLLSAQMVRVIPAPVLLLLIGVPITGFAVLQLIGRRIQIAHPTPRTEAMVGGFAGFIGGFSGVWGPPTVAYLTALGTEKGEQMRVQGVIYGMGAVALTLAHVGSGVLSAQTLPFSAAMVVPAMAGMAVGGWLHDRVDQATFRRATLAVLSVAGCSLIARGLIGLAGG